MTFRKSVAVLLHWLFKQPLTLWTKLCYRIEVTGVEHCPRRGGLVVVSNHQSFLDPLLLGVALPRTLVYTPRASLSTSWVYRLLTAGLDLEHVARDGRDVGAARRMIERVQRGEVLALFPEQTRTRDGRLGRVTPGFHMVAANGNVPVLPIVIEGAYDIWPRGRKLPHLTGKLRIRIGAPIDVTALDRRTAARRVEAALVALGARPGGGDDATHDATKTNGAMNESPPAAPDGAGAPG